MATLEVQPRDTPGERADAPVSVEIDDAPSVPAAQLEEWAARVEQWELQLREGHGFGRANHVEARLLSTGGDHACSLAKGVHLAPHGFDVELHHVVGPAFGGTAA